MVPIFLTDARPSTEGDFYVDGSVTNDGAALIDSNLSIVKHKIQKSPMLVNKKTKCTTFKSPHLITVELIA